MRATEGQRNTTLVSLLARAIGRNPHRSLGDLLAIAEYYNTHFIEPLGTIEVFSITAKVRTWKASAPPHSAAWLLKQKARSLAGNAARTRKAEERAAAAREMRAEGVAVGQIAEYFGCSTRQVIRWTKARCSQNICSWDGIQFTQRWPREQDRPGETLGDSMRRVMMTTEGRQLARRAFEKRMGGGG